MMTDQTSYEIGGAVWPRGRKKCVGGKERVPLSVYNPTRVTGSGCEKSPRQSKGGKAVQRGDYEKRVKNDPSKCECETLLDGPQSHTRNEKS